MLYALVFFNVYLISDTKYNHNKEKVMFFSYTSIYYNTIVIIRV